MRSRQLRFLTEYALIEGYPTGTGRSLLALGGQSPVVEGFENVRSSAIGVDQGESHRTGVALVRKGMDQERPTRTRSAMSRTGPPALQSPLADVKVYDV